MNAEHITLEKLSYTPKVKAWINDRYGKEEGAVIWKQVEKNYNAYLEGCPEYGGKKNGHGEGIYGGMLIFALYPALPDQPPVEELSEFVSGLFMEPFRKLGKVFNLNRSRDMWIIEKVFKKVARRDAKDIKKYPAGFITVPEPYDKEHHVARYHFEQCPNADFARGHGLLHVLPLLCNSDFTGIDLIHGKLIRCGTCGNSDKCDYMIMGDENPLASNYELVADEGGFLVSRRKEK